ncbi:MAG: AMP-binding protein [Actinobacteria bacterium]|nr:AMP-binding protein [Actinomycetota bacterium]
MFRNLTVANLIDRAARKYGDKLFAVGEEPVKSDYLPEGHDGLHFTCNDTLEITNLFAAAMRGKLGVGAGDRIAVVLTNVPEMGTIFTAAARLGAITVPFNYMLKAEELTRMVNDCGAKVLFTEPELFRANIRDKANVPGIDHWIMIGPPDEVPEGFLSLDDLEELVAWCRERIAAYKAPRRIILLEQMPLTMTLKVMKKDLRRRLEEEQA